MAFNSMTIHFPGDGPADRVTDSFLDVILFLQQNDKLSNVSFTFKNETELEQFRTKQRYSDRTAEIPDKFIIEDDYTGNADIEPEVVEKTDVTAIINEVLTKYSDSITIEDS